MLEEEASNFLRLVQRKEGVQTRAAIRDITLSFRFRVRPGLVHPPHSSAPLLSFCLKLSHRAPLMRTLGVAGSLRFIVPPARYLLYIRT